MINFLVTIQKDSESSELIESAIPSLEKYHLLDAGYEVDKEKSGQDNLQAIVEAIVINSEEGALIFDEECIDEKNSYSDLALEIFRYADVKSEISKIKSSLSHESEKAGIAILIGDKPIKKVWSQPDDWVSEEFYEFIDGALESNFNKKIIKLPAQDQCMRLMVVDTEDFHPINHLLRFNSSGYSHRELYSARVVSTIFLSIAGGISFTLAGWYFLGFLWSLLASAGLWSLIAVSLILKYAWACAQDEEAEELAKADPVAFGKAISASIVEEAAAREGDSEMGRRLRKVAEINRNALNKIENS